ncbi:MAG: HD domain-containing protein [Spirochaetota bacterium]|nr:HD domain-containing protein [Spirochaetota bacterium]
MDSSNKTDSSSEKSDQSAAIKSKGAPISEHAQGENRNEDDAVNKNGNNTAESKTINAEMKDADNAASTQQDEKTKEKTTQSQTKGENKDEQKEDVEKVPLKVSHLKPGSIIKGKIFSEDGKFLFEEYHIFNEEELDKLKEDKIENIYYTPITDLVSSTTQNQSLKFMEQFINGIKSGKNANIDDAKKVVDLLVTDVFSQETGIINLIELKNYDDYLYVHSVNVGILSIMLGKKLAFNDLDIRTLGLGSFIHDAGKINTPAELLWKVHGKDDYEQTILSEHPMFGYKILGSSGEIVEDVLNIVVGHHENFDGSGYPARLADKSIGKLVKIVSICNYYDYLVEKTESKESLTPREAVLKISSLSGTMFNPIFVNAFINELSYLLLDEPLYPPGSLVILDTKEIAKIEEVKRYSDLKPLINIMSNHKGKKLQRPILVNLKNDHTRHILKSI